MLSLTTTILTRGMENVANNFGLLAEAVGHVVGLNRSPSRAT